MMTRSKKNNIPDGIWLKCSGCGEAIYNGELNRNLRICPKCGYYFPLHPAERVALLADKKSFLRYDNVPCPNTEDCDRAIITGEGALSGRRLVIGATNTGFTSEDIGLFVSEKIVKAIAHAVERRLPLLLICANSNGQQLQNSILRTLSISAALNRLAAEKLLYISVLANSSSHGDFPGFVYIADIVTVESNVPSVSRAVNQNGAAHAAQTLFRNGMVDMIVPRGELRQTLAKLLRFFC